MILPQICSDVDTDTCCQANPDSKTTNEYQVGKTDKKTSKHFGDCAKILLKASHFPSCNYCYYSIQLLILHFFPFLSTQINNGPIVTATKKGKDSLNVTKLKFGLYSQALNKITNYDCGGFKFVDDCKLNPSACTKTTQCKKWKFLPVALSLVIHHLQMKLFTTLKHHLHAVKVFSICNIINEKKKKK